jgi:SLOG family YspA-like protein
MRTILCTGSRGWERYDIIFLALESIRRPFRIIVGDAKSGADPMFWKAAVKLEVPRLRYDANWKRYHFVAGPKRNTVMLEALKRVRVHGELSAWVLAAWDLRSSGTRNMIDQAKLANFDVVVLSNKEG